MLIDQALCLAVHLQLILKKKKEKELGRRYCYFHMRNLRFREGKSSAPIRF